MKTLSLKTSKRLKDYLKDIETEYYSYVNIDEEELKENIKTNKEINDINKNKIHIIKRLTLVRFEGKTLLEAIDEMIIFLLDENCKIGKSR